MSAAANLIKILQTAASLFRRLRKNAQAEALEKTVEELKNKEEPTNEDIESALRRELKEEDTKEVMDVVNILQEIFPVRPKGKMPFYGLLLKELITEATNALKKFDVFRFYGEKAKFGYRLEMSSFSARLYLQSEMELNQLFPAMSGGYWKGFLHSLRERHRYLSEIPFSLEYSSAKARIFLEIREDSPYSVFLVGLKDGVTKKAMKTGIGVKTGEMEKRLDYSFSYLTEGLLEDVRVFLEKISSEHEKKEEEAERIKKALSALRQLSSM